MQLRNYYLSICLDGVPGHSTSVANAQMRESDSFGGD